MSRLEAVLGRAVSDLRGVGASFALVGGLAVSARAEPRFTRDADLAVSVAGDREAEELVQSLRQEAYDVLAGVEQEATGRLSARSQDRADLSALVAHADDADLGLARRGVELIAARGYDRGRDLAAARARLLA